jgi:LysM repeat protein
MAKSILILFAFTAFSIGHVRGDSPRYWKSSRDPQIPLEELKQQISLLRNDLRNQEVELKQLKEKTLSHDEVVDSLVDDVENSTKQFKDRGWSAKIDELQTEIDTIKQHANKIADAVAVNRKKTNRLEESIQQQEANLETIESALNTMMDALGIKDQRVKIYTVKPGDSLGGIAMKYNTTITKIKKVNSLKSDKIIVGQKLKMP